MKLTLTFEEIQQVVTGHLNQQGLTLDTTNVTYNFSADGCEINFGLETTKKPTKKRKPKEQEIEVVKETTEDATDDTDKLTESDEPFDDDDNYSVFG